MGDDMTLQSRILMLGCWTILAAGACTTTDSAPPSNAGSTSRSNLSRSANLAVPDWVRSSGSSARFQASEFLTGFGMSAAGNAMSAPDKLESARNMAMARLTAGLQVHIQTETLVNQFSSMVGRKEELVDEFKSKVSARSDLRLDGVRFEEYVGGRGEPSYALAYLEKEPARVHYRELFRGGMQRLIALQDQGNRQLAGRDTAAARATFGECEKVIGEIEQIVMVLGLLDVSKAMTDDDLRAVLEVKSKSRELWSSDARSMEEAAELLALKLAAQKPPRGKVQVNALMLEDWFQYSQFSAQFRTALESAVASKTGMQPMNLAGAVYTPDSAGKQRLGLAEGAELLLTGNYFLKPDAKKPEALHCFVRVSDAKTGATVAAAEVRLASAAVGSLEVKPRNWKEMLEDQRLFQKDEFVGGGLNLEVWTSHGAENLLLEDGDELKICLRANKPCFVRFLYHLNNGARIVPDPKFINFPIRAEQVNKVVELPETFEMCAPFGAEIMQFFAYTEEQPGLATVREVIDGQPYDVVTNGRGIRKKIEAPEKTEVRINVTTVAKGKAAAKK